MSSQAEKGKLVFDLGRNAAIRSSFFASWSSKDFGQWTVIVFINFKSALKCIDRATLWRTLEAKHISKKIITLLKSAYHGSTSLVQQPLRHHCRRWPRGYRHPIQHRPVLRRPYYWRVASHHESWRRANRTSAAIQTPWLSVASMAEIHSRISQVTAAFAYFQWCIWKKTNVTLISKIHLHSTAHWYCPFFSMDPRPGWSSSTKSTSSRPSNALFVSDSQCPSVMSKQQRDT